MKEGDRVVVDRIYTGTVRYIGRIGAKKTHSVGVELDTPHGTHNGTIMGKTYFACKPRHGVFREPSEVRRYSTSEYNTTNIIECSAGSADALEATERKNAGSCETVAREGKCQRVDDAIKADRRVEELLHDNVEIERKLETLRKEHTALQKELCREKKKSAELEKSLEEAQRMLEEAKAKGCSGVCRGGREESWQDNRNSGWSSGGAGNSSSDVLFIDRSEAERTPHSIIADLLKEVKEKIETENVLFITR